MTRVTRTAGGAGAAAATAHPYLFLALQAHRPAVVGAAFRLGDGPITLGGGERNAATPRRIDLLDPWASSTHARLSPALDRWQVEDAGSKNGTFVNGQRVRAQVLADGDVVEIGHSFLVYRAAIEDTDRAAPVDVDGLRTVLPPLGARFATLARVAAAAVPIVIRGESGTGKEAVATAVHRLSHRPGPLIAFNCGALTDALVQSELFGHRAGAFSGATEDRPGLVRSADRGTLFLDEIAELRPAAQVALLRVLEQREVLAVGATRPHPVDIRVVVATHRDLDACVAAGTFREDLYNRIAGFTIELPPLRERREDLSLFVAEMLARLGATDRSFTPAAARVLFGHPWPGNLRQLWKCLEAAVVIASDGTIGPEHLGLSAPQPAPIADAPALDPDDAARRDQLVALLGEHGGNVAAIGRELGKAPGQIRRWLRRYGLDPDAFRK